MNKTLKLVVGGAAVLYLMNLTFGVVEVLPDNMPLVGNLDEGAVAIVADEFLLNGAIRKLISKNQA